MLGYSSIDDGVPGHEDDQGLDDPTWEGHHGRVITGSRTFTYHNGTAKVRLSQAKVIHQEETTRKDNQIPSAVTE